MTRNEAIRQTEQQNTLMALGFTPDEAEALRRISVTLHRWHEWECGMNDSAIVRGRWDDDRAEFIYDDDHGHAYLEHAGTSGRHRYTRIPDRETSARKRLAAILKARNARRADDGARACAEYALSAYIQTDPRGAALYLLRPGDVPEGQRADSYYTRGICVW